MKATAYTANESREITEFLHLNIIERLLQESSWVYKDIVFQGGTSLHLAWRSPRFSEDLDFLLSEDRENEIVKILSRTAKKLSADVLFMIWETRSRQIINQNSWIHSNCAMI